MLIVYLKPRVLETALTVRDEVKNGINLNATFSTDEVQKISVGKQVGVHPLPMSLDILRDGRDRVHGLYLSVRSSSYSSTSREQKVQITHR